MGQRKTITYEGRQVQGEVLDFEAKAESWNQYALEDGSAVKIKTVLLEIARLDEYNEINEPIYVLTAQQIIGTTVADVLKKKTS